MHYLGHKMRSREGTCIELHSQSMYKHVVKYVLSHILSCRVIGSVQCEFMPTFYMYMAAANTQTYVCVHAQYVLYY